MSSFGQKILVCRTSWMEFYNNTKGKGVSGHGYIKDGNVPTEATNFKLLNGFYYGYVPGAGDMEGKPSRIDITRLGANKNDDKIDDILVVWCATHPDKERTVITGFYPSATVFREAQKDTNNRLYRIVSSDVISFDSEERYFEIPTKKDGIGQRDHWFGFSEDKHPAIRKKLLKYFESQKPSKKYSAGEDQTTLSEIATAVYGGYTELLKAHGWQRTSGPIMNDASQGIVKRYGSIKHFENLYNRGALGDSPLTTGADVWITSFWGWSPKFWGGVGFTNETRLQTLINKTTDPFIMAVYVTENTPEEHFKPIKGKVVGYYELSHQTALKSDLVSEDLLKLSPEDKWKYTFKALRAWTILEEYQPDIRDFYPEIHDNGWAQSVSTWSRPLPSLQVSKLATLPCREVKVFGNDSYEHSDEIIIPKQHKGYSRGGNFRQRGYSVSEPKNTEKELYVLQLMGNASAFLGKSAGTKGIYKVGLSMSPKTRKSSLNSAFPRVLDGTNTAYHWEINRTTVGSAFIKFPDFKSAETQEMVMKKYLGVSNPNAEYLGGEFYLAEPEEVDIAWQKAHKIQN